ncbi:MAG: dethiobiotin synthase [Nitrospiraceae bacterium]|nr:MAG: dethiobiotin synthase [Nitrospiraceae bacterium]
MTKGIFITGTDTGVGKTFIAEGLIRAMRKRGTSVCPMKPVETGCPVKEGMLVPGDALRLMKASGIQEPLNLINPYRFRRPLAPAVAAGADGVRIRKGNIISAYHLLSRRYSRVLIEGAGGIMVPLSGRYLFLDLVTDLGVPVLIVARPGLGTVNHTLLTVDALRHKGALVIGVVLNAAVPLGRDPSVKDNPAVIEKLGRVPVLGVVPHGRTMAGHCLSRVLEAIEGLM